VEVALGPFVGMYLDSYLFRGRDPAGYVSFLATVEPGEIRINREASDLRWFDLRQPPPLTFASMDAAVRDAAKFLIS
jgi:8-oxo-dGTP diphosphatase